MAKNKARQQSAPNPAKKKRATKAAAPIVTPQHAGLILQFLTRTDIKGAEMPAYVECFNVLNAIAQPETTA